MSAEGAVMTTESLLCLVKTAYSKVQILRNESSKDPETEPYKSKYEAEKILKEIKSVLSDISEDLKCDSTLNYKAILSHVYFQLGCIALDVEETQKAEEYFRDCLNLVESDALSSKHILTVLSALNFLGILWSQKLDASKAFEYLSRAENLYKDYIKDSKEKPIDVLEIIFDKTVSSSENSKKSSPLDILYTSTLHHLAEIHFVLGNDVKSAVYCHETLSRQLASEEFDAIEWALDSATLAQFFLKKSGFKEARNHLAAASVILDKYESELYSVEETSEELEAKKERFQYRSADVARCWAKYGLMLLSASKERLLESDSDTQETYPDELKALNFDSLDLSAYESQVTAQYILMFEDARLVFFNVRHWLKKAEEYYQLENHASDYAKIVQDMSELYKILAFYEDDESRQSKMYKRQIDCLEDLVGKLNPQYYLDICRQVWFELGETYATIFYLKETQLKKENCPNPQLLKKCNHYADQSINNYINFLNSFKDTHGKMPEKFDENWERPILLSFFYIARMLGKIVTADRQLRFDKTKESLNYYELMVDYADANETAANVIGIELGVARDMVKLLPLKLEKILAVPEN